MIYIDAIYKISIRNVNSENHWGAQTETNETRIANWFSSYIAKKSKLPPTQGFCGEVSVDFYVGENNEYEFDKSDTVMMISSANPTECPSFVSSVSDTVHDVLQGLRRSVVTVHDAADAVLNGISFNNINRPTGRITGQISFNTKMYSNVEKLRLHIEDEIRDSIRTYVEWASSEFFIGYSNKLVSWALTSRRCSSRMDRHADSWRSFNSPKNKTLNTYVRKLCDDISVITTSTLDNHNIKYRRLVKPKMVDGKIYQHSLERISAARVEAAEVKDTDVFLEDLEKFLHSSKLISIAENIDILYFDSVDVVKVCKSATGTLTLLIDDQSKIVKQTMVSNIMSDIFNLINLDDTI